MIMSVEEFKMFVSTDIADSVLEAKLQALELLIRKVTNNNFQDRRFRCVGEVDNQTLVVTTPILFNVNDTIMIDNDLCVVKAKVDNVITIDQHLLYDSNCLVTKVIYPLDIKLGVVDMMKWDLENRDKVGIQSETISRHSVTYFDMSGDNSSLGYPKSLTGFLKPYTKARF